MGELVRKLERNLLLRVREPCCRVTFCQQQCWRCRRGRRCWPRRLGLGLVGLAVLLLVGLAPLRLFARHLEAVQIFRRENPKRCGMAAVLCRSGAKWVAASDVGAPLRCAGLVTTAKKATLRPVLSPWFVTRGRLPVLGGTTHPSGSRARRRARFPSTPVVFLNTTGTPEVFLRCVTNRRGPQLRAPRGDYPFTSVEGGKEKKSEKVPLVGLRV